MADLTLENLATMVQSLSDNISKELTQLKLQNIQNSTRIEALIRMLVQKENIKFDDFIDFIDAYVKFTNTIIDISKVQTIADKISAAVTYNGANSLVPIYADDLNVLPAVKSTGSISKALHTQLLNLPHTERFTQELTKLIETEVKETTKILAPPILKDEVSN